MTNGNKISAMNPMGYPPKIEQLGIAPRLDSLKDKNDLNKLWDENKAPWKVWSK